MSANRPFLLLYDIPEVNGVSVCANPSETLWRAGCVRITYSDWVVLENDLNGYAMMMEMERLRRAGVRFRTVPFDASAVGELRDMAIENIRREIAGYVARANASRAEADELFGDEGTDAKKRRRALLSVARHLETKVAEILVKIGDAAARFGITEGEIRAREHAADILSATDNMKARAAAFATAHGILTRNRKRKDGAAGMARSMETDSVPVAVVSDFLREIGDEDGEGEQAADALNASFGL